MKQMSLCRRKNPVVCVHQIADWHVVIVIVQRNLLSFSSFHLIISSHRPAAIFCSIQFDSSDLIPHLAPASPMSTTTPADCPCASNETHYHLYQEIESLKKLLNQRDAHIVTLETALIDRQEIPSFNQSLQQDKHERLQESHKRLQRVNQALEDKLLRVVDRFESERTGLRNEVSSLSIRLTDALDRISVLEKERDQYKSDCLIAVQLLNTGKIDHVLQSLRAPGSSSGSSPTPKRSAEHRTIITTTFPPTSILVDRNPALMRKNSEMDESNDDNSLQQPSDFLIRELNQRAKSNTEYSINFNDQSDSMVL
jgi:hypothetical protein